MNGITRCGAVAFLTALFSIPGSGSECAEVPREITVMIEEGRYTEAREKLREFRRLEPDNPLAIFYLASIESDRNLARALYKEVERLSDRELAARAALARAEMHLEEEDYLAAEPLLVKVVTAHPAGASYADALYRLGMLRLRAGKPDDAILQFQRSRDARTDGFPKTLASAGILECYVALQDWNRVLDASREVLEGSDDTGALTPRVLEAVALAWRELGNEENAQKFTKRLLDNFPRSYQAYAIRRRGAGAAESAGSTDEAPDAANAAGSGRSSAAGDSSSAGEGQPRRGFAIQAGAFSDRLNALRIYNRLKDSGFSAKVDLKTAGDRHFYLVRVYPFATREQADEAAVRVSRLTGARATVVMLE